MTAAADRRGFASPVNVRPCRLHRTRRRRAATPPGSVYVGRPTLWSNPFSGRPRIGHARSVILYRAWLRGDLGRHVLARAGFSDAEIAGLTRWRAKLIERLPAIAGRDLQCWCPLSSDWCHADVLLGAANGGAA